MRKLFLSAALCVAMASCAAAPAMARECVAVEKVLPQIEELKPLGARVVTFPRNEALAVVGILAEAGKPLPEGVKVDAVIMVSGDRAAMLLFVDGDQICRTLTIPLKAAMLLDHAVRGRSV